MGIEHEMDATEPSDQSERGTSLPRDVATAFHELLGAGVLRRIEKTENHRAERRTPYIPPELADK